MDTKLQAIVSEFRSIIAKDGEVEEEDLKNWILLDEEIDDKYKTDEGIKALLEEINKPDRSLSKDDRLIQRLQLYKLNWTDKMIADFQGTTPMAIYHWRKLRHLRPNSVKGGQNETINRTAKRNG